MKYRICNFAENINIIWCLTEYEFIDKHAYNL